MHGFDYSVPHFITRIRGMCNVVTSDLISEVLHISRVEFADYLDCDRLRTVSKKNSRLSFMRHLHHRAIVKTSHAWVLQKVRGSLIW